MSNEKTTTKTEAPSSNFVQRVLTRLNLTDEGKILAFEKLAKKEWQKQIDIRERKIKRIEEDHKEYLNDLNEYLDEAKEKQLATFESPDVESIKNINDRKAYFERYDSNCNVAMANVKEVKAKIEDAKTNHDEKINNIKEEIEIFKTKLSFLK